MILFNLLTYIIFIIIFIDFSTLFNIFSIYSILCDYKLIYYFVFVVKIHFLNFNLYLNLRHVYYNNYYLFF